MSAASPERSSATLLATAVAAAAGISAFEIGGLSARDGLFLSELPTSQLPAVMIGAGIVSLLATLGLSRWMRSSRPDHIAPLALIASALSFTGIGVLIGPAPGVAAVCLYVQVTGLGPVVASSFWSVVNERFDPYEAKRVVARMAAAGALGGVAGGALAERVATWVGVPALLFTLAGICCVCAWAVTRIGSRPGAHADAGVNDEGSGFALVRKGGLLRRMAVLMLLLAAVETTVEYALKVEAAKTFHTGEELVRFFAFFYTGCGLLAFAIQSLVGDRFLRRFGLAGAVAVLPGAVALLGAPAVLVAKLWTVTLARGAETVASTAFFRAGFQLLYTPMAAGVKRPAKVWVDVASGSAGDILGALLVFGLVFAVPNLPTEAFMTLVVLGALGALALVHRVHRGYVEELTDSLHRGRVEIREEEALDKTTLQAIANSHVSSGRRSLLERVRAYETDQASDKAPSASAGAPASDAPAPPAVRDGAFSAWTGVLESGDVAAIEAALAGRIDASPDATPESRHRLVAWVLPLLADDRVARAARDYLRPLAPRASGQLADALLSPKNARSLRTRTAWLLGGLDDPRAVDALWRGTADDSFPVRVSCARALARIVARQPQHQIDPGEVYVAVARELEVEEGTWARQRASRDEALGERSVLLSQKALGSTPASLEHVFTLLALAHDRNLIASALAGLTSGDDGLRGTALELLESVLPAQLRRELWPRLEVTAHARVQTRPKQQIAEELLESAVGQVVDLDAITRRS